METGEGYKQTVGSLITKKMLSVNTHTSLYFYLCVLTIIYTLTIATKRLTLALILNQTLKPVFKQPLEVVRTRQKVLTSKNVPTVPVKCVFCSSPSSTVTLRHNDYSKTVICIN